MRFVELAKRNFKEIWRDPLSLSLAFALPTLMLFVLEALGRDEVLFLSATMLAPGVALFGFVMLMFSSAMLLASDREAALLSRLLTTPIRSRDFVLAYSLPYLPIAVLQSLVTFGIARVLGLDSDGSAALLILLLLLMAICYIAFGMLLGAVLSTRPLSGAYIVILLLTIFSGAWMDITEIGGPLLTVVKLLPFAHALDAMRDVMLDGAGLVEIAGDLYWVVGYTVGVALLAVLAFGRRMTA